MLANNSSKLTRFWQELKRRKVIYVITVYASASYVLIELVNNVLEPLHLPENLSTIVIIALAIAFPIVIVLSWIFDVTPQGVAKTKAVEEVLDEKKEVASNAWRIATYVSVVIIAGLIIFNVFTQTNITNNLTQYGKSIAVLPFVNDSPDQDNESFINGTMESILNNLCKIKDLRVVSRSSVEQYRDTIVPVPEIARAMMASYILEGSMQKIGQDIRITVQLIDQNDGHVWSEQYDRKIIQAGDQFSLQSEIAEKVAREIGVLITLEELQRIEKVPATDPVVVQLCQKAFSDFIEYRTTWNSEYLESSTRLYGQAMALDSTYPNAITGLGWLYQMKNHWTGQSEEGYLDSVKIYIDRALSYDSENEDAYLLQGFYYWFKRDWTASERSFNKVLEINPNNATAYEFVANISWDIRGNFVEAIKNYEEAIKRNRGVVIANLYRWYAHAYGGMGFFDLFEENLRKALAFDGDTSVFYSAMANLEHQKGNFNKAAELGAWAYSIVPQIGFIGLWDFIYSEQIEEANNWVKLSEEVNPGWAPMEKAYLSLIRGDREEAEQQFDQILSTFKEAAEHSPDWVASGFGDHIHVAMICAYRGQKEEAYMYLDELLKIKKSLDPGSIRHIEINPMFDSLREEERFKNILRKMHTDYQATKERMRLYLKETGRL